MFVRTRDTELRIRRLVKRIKPGTVKFVSSSTAEPLNPLAPPVVDGRRFSGSRKVRLGDVGIDGRLRLDALTRYAQDVSDDDTTDAGLAVEPNWVVRSTVVDELVPATITEELTFVTFCSGIGRSWAERRLTVTGTAGARYEIATLWICVNSETGAPASLTDQFLELYGPAADGRKVSAKLINPKPPADPSEASMERWPLRAVDYDVYGHVNNAAYWALVEQWLEMAPPVPRRTRLEYGRGIDPTDSVAVARAVADGSRQLSIWWLSDGESGPPAASASMAPIDGPLYAD